VKWLLERPLPVPPCPLERRAKATGASLEVFGADPGARDASRLLRLVDTVNTRSGERVRVLWVNETQGRSPALPLRVSGGNDSALARETVREERQVKEERRARLTVLPGGKTATCAPSPGGNWPGPPGRPAHPGQAAGLDGTWRPHGYRSKYLHWCLNFLLLSGAVHSSQLFQEAQALVREVCPDFSKEVRSVLSTLYRKAQAYEAGEKIEFGGRQYPPLYTPKNSTLMELFDIREAEVRT